MFSAREISERKSARRRKWIAGCGKKSAQKRILIYFVRSLVCLQIFNYLVRAALWCVRKKFAHRAQHCCSTRVHSSFVYLFIWINCFRFLFLFFFTIYFSSAHVCRLPHAHASLPLSAFLASQNITFPLRLSPPVSSVGGARLAITNLSHSYMQILRARIKMRAKRRERKTRYFVVGWKTQFLFPSIHL